MPCPIRPMPTNPMRSIFFSAIAVNFRLKRPPAQRAAVAQIALRDHVDGSVVVDLIQKPSARGFSENRSADREAAAKRLRRRVGKLIAQLFDRCIQSEHEHAAAVRVGITNFRVQPLPSIGSRRRRQLPPIGENACR